MIKQAEQAVLIPRPLTDHVPRTPVAEIPARLGRDGGGAVVLVIPVTDQDLLDWAGLVLEQIFA